MEAWFEADGEAVSWPGVASADGVPALGVDGSADGVSVPGVMRILAKPRCRKAPEPRVCRQRARDSPVR